MTFTPGTPGGGGSPQGGQVGWDEELNIQPYAGTLAGTTMASDIIGGQTMGTEKTEEAAAPAALATSNETPPPEAWAPDESLPLNEQLEQLKEYNETGEPPKAKSKGTK